MSIFLVALLVILTGFVNSACGPLPPQTTPAVGGQCPGDASFVDTLAPYEYRVPLGQEFCWAYVKTGSTCTLVVQGFQQCYQVQMLNSGKSLLTFSRSKTCGEIEQVSFFTSSTETATPTPVPTTTELPTTTPVPTTQVPTTTELPTTTQEPTTTTATPTPVPTTTEIPTTTMEPTTPTPTPSCCQPGGAGRSNIFHAVNPNNVFLVPGPETAEDCCTSCVNDPLCIQWVMLTTSTIGCINYRNADSTNICNNAQVSIVESGSIRCSGEGCALTAVGN